MGRLFLVFISGKTIVSAIFLTTKSNKEKKSFLHNSVQNLDISVKYCEILKQLSKKLGQKCIASPILEFDFEKFPKYWYFQLLHLKWSSSFK